MVPRLIAAVLLSLCGVQGFPEIILANFDFGNYKVLQRTQPLVLECNNTVNDRHIQWRLNTTGRVNRLSVQHGNQSRLTITNASDEDTGLYTCGFDYEHPDGTETFVSQQFNVIVMPKLSMVSSKDIIKGCDLILHCEVTGAHYPTPQVVWKKGTNSELDNGRLMLSQYRGVPNARLQINRVQLEDQGRYTCEATNLAGTAFATTMVNVERCLFCFSC